MAILASIFAYLGALAAIIVFFLISADALLYHPRHHMTTPQSELITASSINPDKTNKNAHAPQRMADAGAIPKANAAAE